MEHRYALWYRMYLIPTRSPPLPDDEFDHASRSTQDALVRIANAAWDLRTELVLGRVATILTPFSVVYRTDASRDAVACAQKAVTSFIWMPVRDLLGRRVVRGAQYVVLFHVSCAEPYKALCLARTILEFPSVYIAMGNGRRFDMIRLCYSFSRGGVYGAFFFDRDLSQVYKKVKRYARGKRQFYAMYKQRYPVTVWYPYPHTMVSFADHSLTNLETRVRKLL